MKLSALILLLRSVLSVSYASDTSVCTSEECISDCTLYLAPSTVNPHGLGLYTSVDIADGAIVGDSEVVIPLLQKYKTVPYRGQHRWLSWLNYVRGVTEFFIPKNRALDKLDPLKLRTSATGPQYTDRFWRLDAFAPGIAALASHHPGLANLKLQEQVPSPTQHSKGGISPYSSPKFIADGPVKAGSELFVVPTNEEIKSRGETKSGKAKFDKPQTEITPGWLVRNGYCIENLVTKPSTIPEAGQGAFARRSIAKDSVIVPSYVAVIKREDFIVYQANETALHYEKVLNKNVVVGQELLLNYAYGQADSDVLLVPLSPMVNYINHNSVPNAAIRWAKGSEKWLKKHPLDLIDMSGEPQIEYFALRDIGPDEEIFIDYGKDWQEAWNQHAKEFKSLRGKDYVAAADYLEKFKPKTLKEQETDPYPSNLQTVCHFPRKRTNNCWLPCDIEARSEVGDKTYYTAAYISAKYEVDAKKMVAYEACAYDKEQIRSEVIPPDAITVVDKWGTQDFFMSNAFRHEIGVPKGFYPELWKESTIYSLTPVPHLKPGQYMPITFEHSGKPVTRNAYFVGLPENFNQHMYNYSVRMGAMDMFHDILNGRYNNPGSHRVVDLVDGQWYVQRPFWNSNMHWIIPWNEIARQSYLRALGAGGFDEVLDGIGTGFGLNRLTCFHNTMLGISNADDSNMHADFYESNRRSFDFLVPLIMANTTRPELNLESKDGNVIVGVKYRFGVSPVMGDWTYHKSAPTDYLGTGEIRVVTSIYCAEIDEQSKPALVKMYHEEYPAPFLNLFDLPIDEWHWDREGMTLPK